MHTRHGAETERDDQSGKKQCDETCPWASAAVGSMEVSEALPPMDSVVTVLTGALSVLASAGDAGTATCCGYGSVPRGDTPAARDISGRRPDGRPDRTGPERLGRRCRPSP